MQSGKLVGGFKLSVAGAVLALALAGCTELTPTAGLPDTPSSTASTVTPSATESSAAAPTTSAVPTTTYTPEEQAVIDQYKGYYNAIYEVPSLEPADLREGLGPYVVASSMDKMVASFQSMAQAGEMPAGHVVFGLIAVSISDGVASVTECRDTTTELIVSAVDGTTKSQGAPGTKVEASLQLGSDQVWRLFSVFGTDFGC